MEIENSDNDNVLRFRLTVDGRCSQMIVKTDAYQNGLMYYRQVDGRTDGSTDVQSLL